MNSMELSRDFVERLLETLVERSTMQCAIQTWNGLSGVSTGGSSHEESPPTPALIALGWSLYRVRGGGGLGS